MIDQINSAFGSFSLTNSSRLILRFFFGVSRMDVGRRKETIEKQQKQKNEWELYINEN